MSFVVAFRERLMAAVSVTANLANDVPGDAIQPGRHLLVIAPKARDSAESAFEGFRSRIFGVGPVAKRCVCHPVDAIEGRVVSLRERTRGRLLADCRIATHPWNTAKHALVRSHPGAKVD